MSDTAIEELRRKLAATEAEAARLRQQLEQAEWLAEYEAAPTS